MGMVEVVLSRDDTIFKGFDHFVWEVSIDNINRTKTIRLATSKYVLNQVTANLQSIYQNVQFIPCELGKGKSIPPEFLQFRLSRKWYFSLDAAIDYQKSTIESLLSTLDGEEGRTTLQVVISPYSLTKQASLTKKAEKIHSLEYRGGIFQCEIRMFSNSEQHKKAVIANLAESHAQNRLIPEMLPNYWLRRLFQKV
jgi:hypothetical protein